MTHDPARPDLFTHVCDMPALAVTPRNAWKEGA